MHSPKANHFRYTARIISQIGQRDTMTGKRSIHCSKFHNYINRYSHAAIDDRMTVVDAAIVATIDAAIDAAIDGDPLQPSVWQNVVFKLFQ